MVHLKEHIWLCQVIRHINDDMMILHHDSNAFKIFQASLTSSFNKELSKSSYIWDLHWAMLSSLAPMPSQAGHGQRQRGVSFHDFGVMRQRYATISELNWIAKHGPSCDQSIPLSDTMRLWRDLVSSCAAACLFPPRGKSTKSIGKPLDWDWSKAQKHFPRCALFWVCDSVTVCDSLWQFVTICDSLWQFVTVCDSLWRVVVSRALYRYSHYPHCVWHKCMIHLWYLHVDLPVFLPFLPDIFLPLSGNLRRKTC